MTTVSYGYLTTPYLQGPYLGGYINELLGSQVNMTIYDSRSTRSQGNLHIYDLLALNDQIEQKLYHPHYLRSQINQTTHTQRLVNIQVNQHIYDANTIGSQIVQKLYHPLTLHSQIDQRLYIFDRTFEQVDQKINITTIMGSQVDQKIYDGRQLLSQVLQYLQAEESHLGSQVRQTTHGLSLDNQEVKIYPLQHLTKEKYLTTPYLTTAYLAPYFDALQRSQVELTLYHPSYIRSQVQLMVFDTSTMLNEQARQKIYHGSTTGSQIEQVLYHPIYLRSQVTQVITEAEHLGGQVRQKIYHPLNLAEQVELKRYYLYALSSQSELVIYDANAIRSSIQQKIYHPVSIHSQVTKIQKKELHSQVYQVIYNVTQLRILQNFMSRGTVALAGNNWTSNQPLRTGDFTTRNLNTDILEQRCETETLPSQWILTCDTGIPQGGFVDTLCILEHNLTTSARVILQGSTDPLFNTVGMEVVLTSELKNTYWIAPTLPNVGFRYYRLIISDTSNPNSSLYIGAIVFGQASILSVAEPLENPIGFGYNHYKESVETEGFRTVSNDRAIRKQLSLSFSNIRYEGGNYNILRNYWLNNKTDLACVIIPRPTKPSAFAVFAKLVSLPREEHNAISDDDHWVSFSLDWDESL